MDFNTLIKARNKTILKFQLKSLLMMVEDFTGTCVELVDQGSIKTLDIPLLGFLPISELNYEKILNQFRSAWVDQELKTIQFNSQHLINRERRELLDQFDFELRDAEVRKDEFIPDHICEIADLIYPD